MAGTAWHPFLSGKLLGVMRMGDAMNGILESPKTILLFSDLMSAQIKKDDIWPLQNTRAKRHKATTYQ